MPDYMMLNYNILPSKYNELNKFKEIMNAFEKNSSFNLDNKDLENLLDKYGLDLFLIIMINEIISKLAINDFENKDQYKNFCQYTKNIFNRK